MTSDRGTVFTFTCLGNVDEPSRNQDHDKGNPEENEKSFHCYPPKLSKWMFADSTPRSSSISRTPLVIIGGPQR